jgi:L-ribulose-5-phosphate 4-epimerase
MKLAQLRQQVLDANLEIVRRGLALFTFGNASGISRADGIVAIKPSGVPYDELTAAHIVLTDLDGNVIEGTLRPSSDLITHILLYRAFASIGGIVHTHSEYATAWAQSGLPIPALGTTHADSFHGPVPITPQLSDEKISRDYVRETGIAIIERFRESNLDPVTTPGCLVAGHAPFSWGRSPAEAAKNAVLLESIARMATLTLSINPHARPIPQSLLDFHHAHKHGPHATYGQAPAAAPDPTPGKHSAALQEAAVAAALKK